MFASDYAICSHLLTCCRLMMSDQVLAFVLFGSRSVMWSSSEISWRFIGLSRCAEFPRPSPCSSPVRFDISPPTFLVCCLIQSAREFLRVFCIALSMSRFALGMSCRCERPCADEPSKVCGCTDLACTGPNPPGEQHNRRWAVYEMPASALAAARQTSR